MMVTSGHVTEARTHPMELRPHVTNISRGQTVITPCSGSLVTEARAQVPVTSRGQPAVHHQPLTLSEQGHYPIYPPPSVPPMQQVHVYTGLDIPKVLGLKNHPVIATEMHTEWGIRHNRKELEGLLKAVDARHRGGEGHNLTIRHNMVMAAAVKLAADCDPRNHLLIIQAACQAQKCSHHSEQPPTPQCPCQIWMSIQRSLGLTYSTPAEFKKGSWYMEKMPDPVYFN